MQKENVSLRRENNDLLEQYDNVVQENILLRKEATKVLQDNKEFQDIISQLSVYAHRMHECKEHIAALYTIVDVYEEDMDNRIARVVETASYNRRVDERMSQSDSNNSDDVTSTTMHDKIF